MKITLSWLQKRNACDDGIKAWQNLNNPDQFAALEWCKENNLSWGNWLIVRLFTSREQKIKYAIFAAEQVIHIFEKKYPSDKRPRNAIKAAKKYLTSKSAAAAAYAADAAYAAAYAADAAAAAAAAYAAAAAAAAADADAAYARKKLQIKILNYGIKLLKKT